MCVDQEAVQIEFFGTEEDASDSYEADRRYVRPRLSPFERIASVTKLGVTSGRCTYLPSGRFRVHVFTGHTSCTITRLIPLVRNTGRVLRGFLALFGVVSAPLPYEVS